MHPNRAFEWQSKEHMLEFVSSRAFAHIFTSAKRGNCVVHAPVVVTVDGLLQFHISRRNRSAGEFENPHVLMSVSGRDAYQSANWYASDDQVPTWHYEAVEVEGGTRRLSEPELIAHLDLLSETMEKRYSPERPWTRAKMSPGKFEAMVKAIVGFELVPTAIRGTRKFNQHKGAADVEATIAGQASAGRSDIVEAISEVRER